MFQGACSLTYLAHRAMIHERTDIVNEFPQFCGTPDTFFRCSVIKPLGIVSKYSRILIDQNRRGNHCKGTWITDQPLVYRRHRFSNQARWVEF
jgi:hypothetical protein